MREIISHRVNPANDRIAVTVVDEPGAGGAHHLYAVSGFETRLNPSAVTSNSDETSLLVLFQNGPIAEAGVNGVTQEVLLAIVADRLQSFQAGAYACPENAEALKHVEAAQEALLSRTRARMARGVEGTHTI